MSVNKDRLKELQKIEEKKSVGHRLQFSGNVFSSKVLEPTIFVCKKVKVEKSMWYNSETHKVSKRYQVKLLLKNDNMSKARWTIPFPLEEIKPQPPHERG
jgi:hypothetical protein